MARLAGVLVAIALAPGGAWAAEVRPLVLEEIAARAGCVVDGTVIAVASGRDEQNIPATWVTVAVRECLKGRVPERFTFKQVGVVSPLHDGTLLRLPGLPRYEVGGRYVLFLHDVSGRGFTSPVGMGQGVHRVERRLDGEVVVGATGGMERLDPFLDRVRHAVTR